MDDGARRTASSPIMGTSTYAHSGGSCNTQTQIMVCVMAVIMFVGFMGPGLAMVIYPETSSFVNVADSWLHENDEDMVWYECVEVYQGRANSAFALSAEPEVDPSSGIPFNYSQPVSSKGSTYEYMTFQMLPGSSLLAEWVFEGSVDVYLLDDDDEFSNWKRCEGCFKVVGSGRNGSISAQVQEASNLYVVFSFDSSSGDGEVSFSGVKLQYRFDNETLLKTWAGDGRYCVPWSRRSKHLYLLMRGPPPVQCDTPCWTKERAVRLEWSHRWYFVAPLMGAIIIVTAVVFPLCVVFFLCGGPSMLRGAANPMADGDAFLSSEAE